jgi:arylsulfatase A-like enzyme
MGREVPEDLPGTSRAKAMRDGESPQEDVFLFWHPQKPDKTGSIKGQAWRGLVSPDGWKYAVSPQEQIGLLFNQNDDPWEQHNRFTDPAMADLRRQLHARLSAWMAREQDPMASSATP